MISILKSGLIWVLVHCLMFLNCPVCSAQAESEKVMKPTTKVIHKPDEIFEAGKRLVFSVAVEDTEGIDVVRLYFKSAEGVNYNFVPMVTADEDNSNSKDQLAQEEVSKLKAADYTAVLPAPAQGSQNIEYLFLVKNCADIVVKTQNYNVQVKDSDERKEEAAPIKVFTEMSEVPVELTGFSDSIVFDTVESSARYGVVADLYSSITTGGGDAVSAGNIVASAGGISGSVVTSLIVAVGVVGGGVALLGGGSSSGQENTALLGESGNSAAPRLISSSPANGTANVPVSSRQISFSFDQSMGQGYSVTWYGVPASRFGFPVWSSDQRTVYFRSTEDLPAGSTLEWVLNPSTHEANFRNVDGVPLPFDQYRGRFFTAN